MFGPVLRPGVCAVFLLRYLPVEPCRVMRPCAKRSLTTWELHEVSIARPMRWSLYQESSKRWTWLRGS